MDDTFGFRRQKFIHTCVKSPTHAHGNEIRGGNLKLLETIVDSQGNGQFATDLHGCIRMSDGDRRTRTFHQMQVTAGDTTCNMNGVLGRYCAGDKYTLYSIYEFKIDLVLQ